MSEGQERMVEALRNSYNMHIQPAMQFNLLMCQRMEPIPLPVAFCYLFFLKQVLLSIDMEY